MKKLIVLILVLCSVVSVALADTIDLSAMSYAELITLRYKITTEIMSRPQWKEVTVPSGVYVIGEDIQAGSYSIECVDRTSIIEVDQEGKISHVFYDVISNGESIGKVTLEEGQTISLSGAVIFRPPVLLGF